MNGRLGVAVLVVLGLWLASSASVARAMQITWTISGTASTGGAPLDFFPNDSAYVLTITFESETTPTEIQPGLATAYDSAIVAASFESATYSPEIELEPPALSRITGLFVPPASGVFPLPTAPPGSNVQVVILELIGYPDPYSVLRSNIDTANIDYSVPEPAIAWASVAGFAIACVRTTRRKPRCHGASDSRFS